MSGRIPIAALALFVGGCCCKSSVEDEVRTAERENAQLRFQVDATEAANKASRDYAAELAASGAGTPIYAMYYTKEDLVRMSTQMLPYRIPANSFGESQLAGEIIVEKLENVNFQAGNRMTARMHLKGQGVRYTGDVPLASIKKQIKSFEEGIAAGVIVDLDVTISFDQGNVVRALATATNTRLKRNSNPSNESRLKNAMNEKALKSPLRFEVGIAGSAARLTGAIVTGNHVVLRYAP